MGGTNHQKSLWAAELWPELLLVKLLSSTFALKMLYTCQEML